MIMKIPLEPQDPLHYIIDSNFFANKYLFPSEGANEEDKKRIENSREWWVILNYQVEKGVAIAYINDLCISETFKIFAKKYYQERSFSKNSIKQ
jgi:hypothetical protein